jgi:hypothetical protein
MTKKHRRKHSQPARPVRYKSVLYSQKRSDTVPLIAALAFFAFEIGVLF